MTTNSLIGTAEAGEILGLSRKGVNHRVTEGRLVPVGTIGKRGIRVFDRSEIERLAEQEGAK